ncbi:MAG: ABC transporter permease [Bacillota bacterium]
MIRLLRLFTRSFSLSLQRELAHRANLLFGLLMTLVQVSAGLATLAMLFTRIETLAGWSHAEVVILLGSFQLITGLMESFVEPNLEWFSEKVTGGQLDDLLLQPVPSLFAVSLSSCRPLSLAQALLGLLLVGGGAAQVGTFRPDPVGAFALLLLLGLVIAWATRLLLASIAFWAPGLEASVLYFALWQLGRYPVSVYHRAVRWILTYTVPVAFVATLPTMALTRGAGPGLVLSGLAMAAGAALAARWVWLAGLRRYTGATS